MDDKISRITSVQQGSAVETYQYLGLNTVAGANRGNQAPVLSVTLDAFGRPLTWDWGTADTYTYGYNADGLTTSVCTTNWVPTYSSSRPANGKTAYPADTTTYEYDKLGDLTYDSRGSINVSGGLFDDSGLAIVVHDAEWQVDCQGTRYDSGGNPITGSYNPTVANSIDLGDGNTSQLKFDAWDRLVQVTSKLYGNLFSTEDYSYDARGASLRLPKSQNRQSVRVAPWGPWTSFTTTSSTTAQDYYDGQNLIRETTSRGADDYYLWSPDGHLIAGKGLYVQYDAQGSTTALIEPVSQQVVERFVYDAYGQPFSLDGNFNAHGWAWGRPTASPMRWQFGFQGQRFTRLFNGPSSLLGDRGRPAAG